MMAEETGKLLSAAPTTPSAATPTRRQRRTVVFVFLLVVGIVVALLVRDSTHTLSDDSSRFKRAMPDFDRHFATKTMYWDQRVGSHTHHVRGLRSIPLTAAAEPPRSQNLRLIQSQVVTRHGIRYPTLAPIKDLEALIAKVSPFETRLPRWLHGYVLQYNASVEGELATNGVSELKQYARRLLASYGDLQHKPTYTKHAFEISHTHVTRTKDSAIAFASVFFENPGDVQYIARPKNSDTTLRFYDLCDRYLVQVKHNKTAVREMHVFAESSAMASAADKLAAALGFDATAKLFTTKDVAAAFSGCAFDLALYGIRDQWCSLFSADMVHSVDYYDDLKAFYQLAGGYPINYEMAAVLLQDIVREIDRCISGDSSLQGMYRFAHAETTLPLMTLLGFGDKTPLRAAASIVEIQSRGFRTSVLAPFAANIEFRVYTSDQSTHFVQVLVNERDDIVIDGCDGVLCPLETLKKIWRRYLEDFDFASACLV